MCRDGSAETSSLVSDVPMLAQLHCPLPSTLNGGRAAPAAQWGLRWASLHTPGLGFCCSIVLRCAGPPRRQLGAMHRVLPCLLHTHPSSPWGTAGPTGTQGPHLHPIPTHVLLPHSQWGHLGFSILYIPSQSHQMVAMNVCAITMGAPRRVQWCPLAVLQGDRQGAAAMGPNISSTHNKEGNSRARPSRSRSTGPWSPSDIPDFITCWDRRSATLCAHAQCHQPGPSGHRALPPGAQPGSGMRTSQQEQPAAPTPHRTAPLGSPQHHPTRAWGCCMGTCRNTAHRPKVRPNIPTRCQQGSIPTPPV